jgi:hypothetical protein
MQSTNCCFNEQMRVQQSILWETASMTVQCLKGLKTWDRSRRNDDTETGSNIQKDWGDITATGVVQSRPCWFIPLEPTLVQVLLVDQHDPISRFAILHINNGLVRLFHGIVVIPCPNFLFCKQV